MEDSSPDLSLKLRRRSSDSRDSFYMDFAQGIDSDIEEVISGAAAPPLGDGDDVTLPPPPDIIGPEDLLPVDEETQRYVTWVPRGRAVGAWTRRHVGASVLCRTLLRLSQSAASFHTLFAIVKFPKATVNFVTTVRPSIRMEHLGSHWTDCHEIWCFEYFLENLSTKFKLHLNLTRITWRLRHIFDHISLVLFLEWETFPTKVVQKIKTHISCSVTFPRESYRLWDNVENLW